MSEPTYETDQDKEEEEITRKRIEKTLPDTKRILLFPPGSKADWMLLEWDEAPMVWRPTWILEHKKRNYRHDDFDDKGGVFLSYRKYEHLREEEDLWRVPASMVWRFFNGIYTCLLSVIYSQGTETKDFKDPRDREGNLFDTEPGYLIMSKHLTRFGGEDEPGEAGDTDSETGHGDPTDGGP